MIVTKVRDHYLGAEFLCDSLIYPVAHYEVIINLIFSSTSILSLILRPQTMLVLWYFKLLVELVQLMAGNLEQLEDRARRIAKMGLGTRLVV